MIEIEPDIVDEDLHIKYSKKVQEMSRGISEKLAWKYDQLKQRLQPESEESDNGLQEPSSSNERTKVEEESTNLKKREGSFEETLFNLYSNGQYFSALKHEKSLLDVSFALRKTSTSSSDVISKLNNIRFEPVDELDSRPILKKIKAEENELKVSLIL